MEAVYCSPLDKFPLCIWHSVSWSFPLVCLCLIVCCSHQASKISLIKNKNVNRMAILQFIFIMTIPVLEILELFLVRDEKIFISEFLASLFSFINAIFCLILMKIEFSRMLTPGRYSLNLRIYFFLILIIQSAYIPMIILFSKESSQNLVISHGIKAGIMIFLNISSIFSSINSKKNVMEPLLFEEAEKQEKLPSQKPEKPDEEVEDYRMTRSDSLYDFSRKNSIFEQFKGNRKSSIVVDIPKALISHDSNEEIIVLYEIKVQDNKGKVLRTIYRRFSEFETLHNEVI